MAKHEHTSTRRALLGAAVAIPAVTATCGSVALAAVQSAEGTAWHALRRRCEELKAAYELHYQHVYRPASDAYLAELPPEPELALSWADDGQPVLTPVSRRYVQELMRMAADRRGNYAFKAEVRRLGALVEGWDADRDRLRAKYNLRTIDEESERLCSLYADMEMRLAAMPAPDAAALGWKIETLWADDPGAGFDEEITNAIVADARRLLTGAKV